MRSHRKSQRSAGGDHGAENPLRSNQLNTNVGRKAVRIGKASRDTAALEEEVEQGVELAGKNLQKAPKPARMQHSRTAEIQRANVRKIA